MTKQYLQCPHCGKESLRVKRNYDNTKDILICGNKEKCRFLVDYDNYKKKLDVINSLNDRQKKMMNHTKLGEHIKHQFLIGYYSEKGFLEVIGIFEEEDHEGISESQQVVLDKIRYYAQKWLNGLMTCNQYLGEVDMIVKEKDKEELIEWN